MKKRTAEWVKKAEADHEIAKLLSRGRTPFHDAVCFHCQQCAEKYLKGLMEERGLPVPKIHILKHLLDSLLPYHPSLDSLRRGLLILNGYAVETRYLDKHATKRQAASALIYTGRVREALRAFLGVRPPKKRKRSS